MIRTRPKKTEFVQSIIADVEWLGTAYDGESAFCINYFDQMLVEAAVKLIKKSKAYVCDLTADPIREYRGTLKEQARTLYRDRSIEENLQLFEDKKEQRSIRMDQNY